MAGAEEKEEGMKQRKIVVAVDEGEESSYALSWCIQNVVNQNSNDTLILLYSKPPPNIYPAIDGIGYLYSSDTLYAMERYNNEVADSVMAKAKCLCKDLNHVVVETRTERGDARDVICEVAKKCKADLVVMGCHGYGVIKRAFLGSVSNYCAQNLKCPVLIVKKKPKSNGNDAAAAPK